MINGRILLPRHIFGIHGRALLLAGAVLAAASGARFAASTRSPGAARARASVRETLAGFPLAFEANRGQADGRVRFLSRAAGYTLLVQPTELTLRLRAAPHSASRDSQPAIRVRLVGGNPAAQVRGVEELPGKSNYFLGSDPRQWRTGVPTYAKVRASGVYPGVDLVYYGAQRQVEYDFVVAPGADPDQIRLAVSGAGRVTLDRTGDLVLHTAAGEVRQHRPVVYQVVNGERRVVDGGYELLAEGNGCVGVGVCGCELHRKAAPPYTGTPAPQGPTPNAQRSMLTTTPTHPHTHTPTPTRTVAFNIGAYDRSRPLIIDPTVYFSSYLGGRNDEEAYGVAVDRAGYLYVTGRTASANFPSTSQAYGRSTGGAFDAFVTKLDPANRIVVYSTYLGGEDQDQANAIAVDETGGACITGHTFSGDFPTFHAYRGTLSGSNDAFVTRLNATGTALTYSTYLGGSGNGNDAGNGIAVDSAGNLFVTGNAATSDFPVVSAYQATLGGMSDAFVARVDPAATGNPSLLFSTYLGGIGNDQALAIAVDVMDRVYITGETDGAFPTTVGAYKTLPLGDRDVFVAKLDSSVPELDYSTYLGGFGGETGTSIAVDATSTAYVTGYTDSTDFPRVNAVQNSGGGTFLDAFVSRINAEGTALVFSTYLGGGGNDVGKGIAVDNAGTAYVVGGTMSANFPAVASLQPSLLGVQDAFIAKLPAAGAPLTYCSFLGGADADQALGVTVNNCRDAIAVGTTLSHDFPRVNATQTTYGGDDIYGGDAFISDLLDGRTIPPAPSNLIVTVLSRSQIRLQWQDNSGGETTFQVWRKVGNGSLAYHVATLPNATTFLDIGLAGDTTYTYQVRAGNATGFSPFSNADSGTTDIPLPPTGLTATGTSVSQIRLDWTNGGSAQTGCRIERKLGTAAYQEIGTTGATVVTYNSGGLTANSTYKFRVRAYNSTGNSPYCTEATGTTLPLPNAPSGLAGTLTNSTQVVLTWNDNSADEANFRVERQAGTGAYSQVAQVNANVETYTALGLTPGTTYKFRVRACNANGFSPYSSEITITPLYAPVNLAGTPLSGTQVRLNWASGGGSATSYRIERKIGTAAYAEIGTVGSGILTYTSTGLAASTTYKFRVRAYSGAHNSSYSNEASATTPAPPTAPTALAGRLANSAQVVLTWNDTSADEENFRVERRAGTGAYSQIAQVNADVETYTALGLTTGTTYKFRVRACNANGFSGYSNEITVTPLYAPVNLAGTPLSGTQVRLNWASGGGSATPYRIECKTGTAAYTEIGTVASGVLTYTSAGLTAATTYKFRVRAYNGPNNSSYSNEASATTLPPPNAPSNLAARLTNSTQAVLTWRDNSSSEANFRAERQVNSGAYSQVAQVGQNVTTWTATGLTVGAVYKFRVRAYNANGFSGYSNEVTVTPIAAPTSLSALALSSNQVQLTWQAPTAGITGFRIERKRGGGQFVDVGTAPAIASAAIDSGLTARTAYTYRIRAYAAAGFSSYSPTASVTTP